jgi:hypothetical protein
VILLLEGLLLVLFAIVGGLAALHRSLGLDSPFHLREWHHAYLGALLVLVGALVGGCVGLAFQLLGVVLTVDDLWEHVVQTFHDEDYESPLHHFYARVLWPMRWVQRLTRWLDGLFR